MVWHLILWWDHESWDQPKKFVIYYGVSRDEEMKQSKGTDSKNFLVMKLVGRLHSSLLAAYCLATIAYCTDCTSDLAKRRAVEHATNQQVDRCTVCTSQRRHILAKCQVPSAAEQQPSVHHSTPRSSGGALPRTPWCHTKCISIWCMLLNHFLAVDVWPEVTVRVLLTIL
jgi:hypothetical protein